MYEAWGRFVTRRIIEHIRPTVAPLSTDLFIRIPIQPRVKSDGSFVTKAFYRSKPYKNPFEDITDKVGLRVIVLLPSDMPIVCTAIEKCPDWEWSKDRDYEEERDAQPFVFGYQSDHYIVRSKQERDVDGVIVRAGTPCEVQVRTMLQHAHSELTHDTIYKPSVTQTPSMQRAAAKSMALLEATGDYFEKLADEIKKAVGPNKTVAQELEELYRAKVGSPPDATKANGFLIEAYAPILTGSGISALVAFLTEKNFVPEKVKERARSRILFRQPAILLAYMAVSKKPHDASTKWPFTPSEAKPIYTDLGETMPD
ncbi:MAG: RelA/SpoT domain-containing protein [Proteobacteria bacterium]|nr:RelA/SpoT domain-containing protein [Pseudomonadota bacterium]